jgi:phosphate/sulfate permease
METRTKFVIAFVILFIIALVATFYTLKYYQFIKWYVRYWLGNKRSSLTEKDEDEDEKDEGNQNFLIGAGAITAFCLILLIGASLRGQ